ncbi:MAG: hypothetical protein OXG08_04300 [Gammaproteobacteria bacterium]|nr:hypothetical protein [Gammaproteobacteria bacterium]
MSNIVTENDAKRNRERHYASLLKTLSVNANENRDQARDFNVRNGWHENPDFLVFHNLGQSSGFHFLTASQTFFTI